MKSAGIPRGILAAAAPATAQTPSRRRRAAAGIIGERYDGYFGVHGAGVGSGAQPGRSDQYPAPLALQHLASSKGASPQDVGITAGCQLLARIGVGEAYMLADGVWHRRAAGQSAVPDYCR